jgi:hypothetical protein
MNLKISYKKSNMVFIIVCQLLFVLFSCGGKNNNPDIPDTGDEPKEPEPEIIYDAIPVPPVIATVDESDYTIYYVDGGSGNDDNDGLSESNPFKTLDKVSNLAKKPKTKILFKKGAVFSGTLHLENLKGTESKPFIVDSYGSGEKPTIDGNGKNAAVEIQDGNIRFRNIHITNSKGARGIYVAPKVAGAFKNLQIAGCRIENVNWEGTDDVFNVHPKNLDVEAICSNVKYGYNNGGIIFEANTLASIGASWFEDIFITGNEIFKVSRTGIWLNTQWGKRPGLGWGRNVYVNDENGWYPAKNIIVQNNHISYTGGDATVLIATKNSFLDHNTAMHANYLGRTGYFNAGIWPHSSVNFVMQFNEVAYTHLENGGGDGEGLDVDIACVNTLVQYNYVHHNDGGGLLVCNNRSDDGIGNHQGTVIRNNVFFDNGKDTDKAAFLTVSSAVGKTDVYNNIIMVSNRLTNPLFILSADWADIGKSTDFIFRNNILIATAEVNANFELSYINGCVFDNNLAYQIGNVKTKIGDNNLLTYDPKITVPDVIDGYVNGLKFKPAEPNVFKDGIVFNSMSDTDMAGNPTQGVKYIGAFCK